MTVLAVVGALIVVGAFIGLFFDARVAERKSPAWNRGYAEGYLQGRADAEKERS